MIVPKLETEICEYLHQLSLEQQRHVSKAHCVDSAVDLAIVILNDFKHTPSSKSLERLC
jgi:hypothetical protein